jgi:hypothetical protein
MMDRRYGTNSRTPYLPDSASRARANSSVVVSGDPAM